MFSARVLRQIALVAGAAAIVGSGALTACSSPKEKPAQSPVSPSEKVNVGSFTPAITATPAPTALPGRN